MNRKFVRLNLNKPVQKNNMSTEHSHTTPAEEHRTSPEVLEIGDEPTPDMTVATSHDSLKELIEKNIKWSQVVYHQNKAIKHRLTLMVLGSYLRLALILTPIILGIIYLPPFISDIKTRYESVMNNLGTNSDISDILQQFFGGGQDNAKKAPQGRK